MCDFESILIGLLSLWSCLLIKFTSHSMKDSYYPIFDVMGLWAISYYLVNHSPASLWCTGLLSVSFDFTTLKNMFRVTWSSGKGCCTSIQWFWVEVYHPTALHMYSSHLLSVQLLQSSFCHWGFPFRFCAWNVLFCSASFFQMALYGEPNQSIFPLWPILLFIWSNQLFIRLTFHFLYGQLKFFCGQLLTFDKINFYFLYGQLDFLCGQCKNADWRLQIRGKMQTWI